LLAGNFPGVDEGVDLFLVDLQVARDLPDGHEARQFGSRRGDLRRDSGGWHPWADSETWGVHALESRARSVPATPILAELPCRLCPSGKSPESAATECLNIRRCARVDAARGQRCW
jgi:hypothetical protein